jgi:2-O-A-mannosyl-D-glycerate-specific PTS system IIC component
MRITTLTNSALINLQTTYADRDAAIIALANQLDEQGKLHNKQQYLDAVFEREAHGATALGEGLAVPHGKSDAVKEASFAVATLKETVQWQGVDDDEMEEVNLIFLLAIPNAEAGSTHMKILTDLTSALIDDDTREAVLKATSAAEIITLLDGGMPTDEAESTVETTKHAQSATLTSPRYEGSEEDSFLTRVGRSISKFFK